MKKPVYIKLSGVLTEKRIREAVKGLAKDRIYHEDTLQIWDFSEADLSGISSGTIMNLAHNNIFFSEAYDQSRLAFVTNNPVEYGLLRMFTIYTALPESRMAVFHTLEEAQIWLLS